MKKGKGKGGCLGWSGGREDGSMPKALLVRGCGTETRRNAGNRWDGSGSAPRAGV